MNNRFKIWRSHQPIWVNNIIDIFLTAKDLLALLLMGIIAMAILGLFVWAAISLSTS